MKNVENIIRLAGLAGRFCWRHKRLTVAAVGLLAVVPLLNGSVGGTTFLNPVSSTGQALVGLGIAALWEADRRGPACGAETEQLTAGPPGLATPSQSNRAALRGEQPFSFAQDGRWRPRAARTTTTTPNRSSGVVFGRPGPAFCVSEEAT